MAKNDGGPAFPELHFREDEAGKLTWQRQYGMSLRDYFAAAIATGNLSDVRAPDMTPEVWANHVWRLADAMLAEREK